MATGNITFGRDYFPRPKDENKIWRKLKQGNHLLLLAPRRVGKSSMIHHLKSHPQEGYSIIYSYVQACQTEQAFYEKLLTSINESDLIQQNTPVASRFKAMFAKLPLNLSVEVVGIKVETKDSSENTCVGQTTIRQILMESLKDSDTKVVLAIDEFPDVLINIYDNKGESSAKAFLASIRELCQDVDFTKRVQFIFTGSIGLDTLTKKLNFSNLINMLENVGISELSHDEALTFINFYLNNQGILTVLDNYSKNALIQAIGWNMPYYLALACDQLIDDYGLEGDDGLTLPSMNENKVVESVNQLLKQENTTRFTHWKERLNRLEILEKKLAHQILKAVSEEELCLSYAEAFNLSQQADFKESVNFAYLMDCLTSEGYLFQLDDKSYRFTSPLLKHWWQRYGY